MSNSERVLTGTTVLPQEITSIECPPPPQVSKTKTMLPVPKLTEISKAMLVSSVSVHSLKALCVLVIHHHNLPRNWVYTRNSTQNGDHNYNGSASVQKLTNVSGIKESRLIDNLEQMLSSKCKYTRCNQQ